MISLITCGGTIATQRTADGQAVPMLGPSELVQMLPPDIPRPAVQEFRRVPSSHIGLDDMLELARTIQQTPGPVVVSHGTDTLEETAYFLDLWLRHPHPVVVTGAMRAPGEPGSDGSANLGDALRVAHCPQAAGSALVVMAGEIHAAAYVTKMHTISPTAFQSPGHGPVGRVVEGRVELWGLPVSPRPHLPAETLGARVELIKMVAGAGPTLIEAAVASGAQGLVIEGLGGGHVPPGLVPALERSARQVAVVLATRCPDGPVLSHTYTYYGGEVDLCNRGALLSDTTGLKARIKLALGLSCGLDAAALFPATVAVK